MNDGGVEGDDDLHALRQRRVDRARLPSCAASATSRLFAVEVLTMPRPTCSACRCCGSSARRSARAELDPRHFAQADDVAVVALAERQLREVLGLSAKLRVQRRVKSRVGRFEAAGREFDVLARAARSRCRRRSGRARPARRGRARCASRSLLAAELHLRDAVDASTAGRRGSARRSRSAPACPCPDR